MSRPTAAIIPREIIIVPLSVGAPDTGTIFAPRIAKYGGSPPCARTPGASNPHANNATTPTQPQTPRHRLIPMQNAPRRNAHPKIATKISATATSTKRTRLSATHRRVKKSTNPSIPARRRLIQSRRNTPTSTQRFLPISLDNLYCVPYSVRHTLYGNRY